MTAATSIETRSGIEITEEIHVTRITSLGDVYGHSTECCDASGCAGTERLYPQLDADADELHRGDVVVIDGRGLVSKEEAS
jgi:hypothetical protein